MHYITEKGGQLTHKLIIFYNSGWYTESQKLGDHCWSGISKIGEDRPSVVPKLIVRLLALLCPIKSVIPPALG
jgi:hypothetical protein